MVQGCLLGQAHVHAAAAAGAVVGGDLDPVGVLPVHAPGRHRLKARGLGGLLPLVQQDGPDGGVGHTREHWLHWMHLAASQAGPPRRRPLLILGGARRPGAVLRPYLTMVDTGSTSPSWRFITATTSLDEGGVRVGRRLVLASSQLSGIFTS